MDMGFIIGAGSVSVITILGAVVENILESKGKKEASEKVGIVTKSALIGAVVLTVGTLLFKTLGL